MNKNYLNTEKKIRVAFLKLIKDKQLCDITVSEFCRLAEINRTTFYKHYQDIWEIPQKFEKEVLLKIDKVFENFEWEIFASKPEIIIKKLSSIIEENSSKYKSFICCDNARNFLYKLSNIAEQKLLDDRFLPKELKNNEQVKIKLNFISGGIANIYKSWLMNSNISMTLITNSIILIIKNELKDEFALVLNKSNQNML